MRSNINHLDTTNIDSFKASLLEFTSKEKKTSSIFQKTISTENPHPKLDEIPLEERRLTHKEVLPPLTGKYPVGLSNAIIKVPENHPLNCDKEIGVEIIAPTRNIDGNRVHLELTNDNFERMMGMRLQDKKNAGINDQAPIYPKLTQEQINDLQTHSHDQLELIKYMPIVIFSHGLRLDPTLYRPLLEEIASHGYIVLNLNHPSSSSRVPSNTPGALDIVKWDKLMDSEYTEQNIEKVQQIGEEIDSMIGQMTEKGTNNIQFVVDNIRNGNLEALPEEFDTNTPIILAGHSLGGTVSLLAAKEMIANDNSIAGCINLDGRLGGKNEAERTAKIEMPTLLLFTERYDSDPEIDDFMTNNVEFHSNRQKIENVEHTDFTIYPIIDWVAGGDRLSQGRQAHEHASKAIVTFMGNLI